MVITMFKSFQPTSSFTKVMKESIFQFIAFDDGHPPYLVNNINSYINVIHFKAELKQHRSPMFCAITDVHFQLFSGSTWYKKLFITPIDLIA